MSTAFFLSIEKPLYWSPTVTLQWNATYTRQSVPKGPHCQHSIPAFCSPIRQPPFAKGWESNIPFHTLSEIWMHVNENPWWTWMEIPSTHNSAPYYATPCHYSMLLWWGFAYNSFEPWHVTSEMVSLFLAHERQNETLTLSLLPLATWVCFSSSNCLIGALANARKLLTCFQCILMQSGNDPPTVTKMDW